MHHDNVAEPTVKRTSHPLAILGSDGTPRWARIGGGAEYHEDEALERIWRRGQTMKQDIPAEYLNQIVTGDARVLAERIPDASVDLIFTDPVYWQIDDYAWLSELGARVLKPGGNCLAYCGNVQQVQAGAAMLPYLTPRPVLSAFMCPPYPRLFDAKCHVNTMPLLWFTKEKGKPIKWVTLQYSSSYHHKNHGHQWGKNFAACLHWLSHFGRPGDVILEPFTGGATTLAGCKVLGLDYIAFEIDPSTADRARARVEATQAMHPAFLEEQEAFAL